MSYVLAHDSQHGRRWVAGFDPDWRPDGAAVYPCGRVDFTDDPAEALTFDSIEEALRFRGRRSTTVPERPDGQPNRPLTAFTLAVDPAPKEQP